MKVFVYGTLKQGYGNHRILADGNATFISEFRLPGYKLYNSGFPVATEDENSSVLGEIWDIGDNQRTLQRLDNLESEGFVYNRVYLKEYDFSLYVGHPEMWRFDTMKPCQILNDEQNPPTYVWGRAA